MIDIKTENKRSWVYIIIILLSFAPAVIFAISFGLTTKYEYIDVSIHYHNDTCYVNNCSSSIWNCCTLFSKENRLATKSKDFEGTLDNICNTCYHIIIRYSLILLNSTNNTNIYKRNRMYDVDDPNYCNQTVLTCYYDDRNILGTLSLKPLYTENQVIPIIITWIVGVCLLTFVPILIILLICHSESRKTHSREDNAIQLTN